MFKQVLLEYSILSRSGPVRVILPPNLTSTSYSVWLAVKKEARLERAERLETNMWLAPGPVTSHTSGRLLGGEERGEDNDGESLAGSVRRGLLRAGAALAGDSVTSIISSVTDPVVESLADQVRAGLLMAGSTRSISVCSPTTATAHEFWVVPEARDRDLEDPEDDESIVTLDTVTDTSLDLEQFDVVEDIPPLLATWIAK